MTLLESECNKVYRVVKMEEPENIERRLEALGLIGGTPIVVLNRKKKGAEIVKVRGTRFAMGREIAAGITVTDQSGEAHNIVS